MKLALGLVIIALLYTVHAQVPGIQGHYEFDGGVVSTAGDILIACIQDSGQLWVYGGGSPDILTSVPAVCQNRANDNGGCGLLLSTSDIMGVLDDPLCFDVMSQGNPRDSWAVNGRPEDGDGDLTNDPTILGQSDLYYTVSADSPEENWDVENNIVVDPVSGSSTQADPLHLRIVVIDTSYSANPQMTVVYDCYNIAGITQTIICDVSITNNLAVTINDVRFRKSTDYDPRGGVINTITILNNLPLGVSIGLMDSPYSYEQSVPGSSFSSQNCPDPTGCGPDQLGVSFEIPIGSLTSGQTYRFQMYYGGANDRDALTSNAIGLFAVDANIAFYGETFSRAFVADISLTNCINADSAAPCFDADSWLLGVGFPYTDCGCWSLWECDVDSPPLSPIMCSGPTEYYASPILINGTKTFSYLIHSTTTSQAYRFDDPSCTLTGRVGDCAPATTTIRADYEKKWFCRTFDRQCVTFTAIPTNEIEYNIDIGPAAGIDCSRCLNDDCEVEEGNPPLATRECYAYWTCPVSTTSPSYPTLCATGPVAVIGPDTDETGVTEGWIIHSDTPGQTYTFPAGCVQQYLFGADCDPDTAGPLREDWQLRYPCGSTTGICTTPDFDPTSGNTYTVDIGPAPVIDCDTCLDSTTCNVPKSTVPDAQCSDYVFP